LKNLEWIVVARERTQSVTISSESYENKLFEILSNPKAQNDTIFDHIEVKLIIRFNYKYQLNKFLLS
jgi:hypothetical protein